MRGFRTLPLAAALGVYVSGWCGDASAAGTLRAAGAAGSPIELADHSVRVVINNGFARTEVHQTFHNPNAVDLDAVYQFPLPPDAALSEMTIAVGDRVLEGEVVERERAERIYAEQVQRGEQAGLAVQNGYQNFQFSVGRVPALGDATMSFVYYEPMTIDTGVGRFLYPLENGGTDDGRSFWTGEDAAVGAFSFDLELTSATPVADVRVPGVPGVAIMQIGPGHYTIHFDAAPSALDRDVVAYYRLNDELPGKLEVVPYRSRGGGPGTFMMIVTPGVDLAPLTHGADYVYVLDFSGSMATKIETLREAVGRALLELGPEDRFRLIGFADQAFSITNDFANATPENVSSAMGALGARAVLGGTNLYDGLGAGLAGCDSDRVTSVFLVTDGVANEGIVDPFAFDALLRTTDVRVFGFLMGNSANWPLMQILTRASGGFYAPVSNADDVLGQVLLAKSKLTHESLHDARLELTGAEVWDTTDFDFGKVYRGQQLVVFGRYAGSSAARMNLVTKIRGQEKTYSTTFTLPDVAEDSPELERLWALDMIHAIKQQRLLGLLAEAEARDRVRTLGLDYQLVTEETAMIVLDAAAFSANGVERANQARTATEHAAQGSAGGQPPPSADVGGTPFPNAPPSLAGDAPSSRGNDDEGYGGALDGSTVAFLVLSLLASFGPRRARSREEAA